MNMASREQSDLRRLFHDINGEIFLIRGNADMARLGLTADAPGQQQLQEIIKHTEILSEYLQQAHDFCVNRPVIPEEKAL